MPATYTLVFETSTPHASIALSDPDGELKQCEFSSDRNHNAMLFAPLQELLSESIRKKIGLVLVGSGPGSYSGTRVGIAAAQGIGIALGCPTIAVPSILAVASAQDGARCLAIGDARRGSYWTSRVENYGLVSEPELCDAEELEIAIYAAEGVSMFSFEDPARFPLPVDFSARVKLEFPDAAKLWRAWQGASEESRHQWAIAPPQPIYLKPPHITPTKRGSLIKP